jgi:hypothetical protein
MPLLFNCHGAASGHQLVTLTTPQHPGGVFFLGAEHDRGIHAH